MATPVLEFKDINTATIHDVTALLTQRNQTLAAYVVWKYLNWRPDARRGVVAYQDGEPAGCFGLIPRTLRLPGGSERAAAWFADWFVAPRFRQSGLGRELLAQLSQQYDLLIGHPGTAAAQKLCASYGYRPLPFQARRRLMLKSFAYETLRTKFFPKAVLRVMAHQAQALYARWNTAELPNTASNNATFTQQDAYGAWMFQQPVRASIKREYDAWETVGARVFYCDDTFLTGERRRRVLYSDGANQSGAGTWRAFFAAAREQACSYVELFTSDRSLDNVWARLGALPYPDQAVVAYGQWPDDLSLHGWDRENWTFLADNALQ